MDAVQIGRSKKALPWSSILPVGDGFYHAEITPDGTKLTLREMNIATGFVKLEADTAVPPAYLIIHEVGKLEGAFFDVVPAKRNGVVEVPVGTYQVDSGAISKGHKTSTKLARIERGHARTFEVEEGKTYELKIGAPYKLTVATTTEDGDVVVVSHKMRIYGQGGEEYRYLFDEALQPTVEARTAEGKKLGKPEKMRLAEITDWETGPAWTVWFPLDLHIENKGGDHVQVRLTQKSHSLLGGPFDSGWTP